MLQNLSIGVKCIITNLSKLKAAGKFSSRFLKLDIFPLTD